MFKGVKSLKEFCSGKRLRMNLIAVILGIMVLAPMVATAENPNPRVLPVDSTPFGNTYGGWSEEWWKWILSIPSDSNPLLDDGSGEFCAEGQSGNVWFLAGSWAGVTELECKVPVGKALFFPIINVECSTVEGYGETEEDLRDWANYYMDNVKVLEVTVDGIPLQDLDSYRVESSLFEFTLPEDNILGLPAGPSQAVADGYWIMLPPLSAGKHEIYVYGKFEDDFVFETEMTYNLEVQPKRQIKP